MKLLLSTENDKVLFLLRIVLGTVILAHGLQKLFGWFGGHGVAGTIELWTQWWNMPPIITALVILCESFGAAALIAGFLGRVMAFFIGVVMVGAVSMVHGRWGFYMNWYSVPQQGEGFEYHLLVMSIVIAIVLKGAGAWSVDRYILNKDTD